MRPKTGLSRMVPEPMSCRYPLQSTYESNSHPLVNRYPCLFSCYPFLVTRFSPLITQCYLSSPTWWWQWCLLSTAASAELMTSSGRYHHPHHPHHPSESEFGFWSRQSVRRKHEPRTSWPGHSGHNKVAPKTSVTMLAPGHPWLESLTELLAGALHPSLLGPRPSLPCLLHGLNAFSSTCFTLQILLQGCSISCGNQTHRLRLMRQEHRWLRVSLGLGIIKGADGKSKLKFRKILIKR